jgi:CspA family cold shock protein
MLPCGRSAHRPLVDAPPHGPPVAGGGPQVAISRENRPVRLGLSRSKYSAYPPRRRKSRFPGTDLFVTVLSCGDDLMAKGTVKWFNPTKGYGFIQPSTGGKDVFVHISAVEKAGLSTLNEGQTVEYEEVANRGKTSAENLKV